MKTPIIRYYLEPKHKEVDKRLNPETILVEVNYGYISTNSKGKKRSQPFRISLNSTIKPIEFGLKQDNFIYNDEVFKRFSRKNSTIRVKMGLFEKAVNELENHYVINQMMPKPKEFKEALKVKLYGKQIENNAERTILDFIYAKIDSDEKDLQIGQKKGIREGTIKSYRTLSRHIENYQIATGEILTFSNFDNSRYWNFWRILNDIYKGEISVVNPNQSRKQRTDVNGYASSALQKHQKNLLRVLRLAKKENELVLDLDDGRLILENSESMKDFYVTEMELQKIIDSDVSYDYRLQMAKEYALIGSLTGMRFESVTDTVNATIEHYQDEKYNFEYMHSKQNKTQTEVYIPLLKPIRDILHLHNGKFPIFPANQTVNEDLKKLFEELKINELVTITKHTYNQGTIITQLPKSCVISSHDFKHSFYSNLYKHKVKQSVIDDITHPDRALKNPMAKIYNRSNMIDKAKMFVDEIKKLNSDVYRF